jgi:SNF2 family DNA or RNA helicase
MVKLDVITETVVLLTAKETYYPSAQEILNFKYQGSSISHVNNSSIITTKEFVHLKIRRKPASIRYIAQTLESDIHIDAVVDEVKLSKVQVQTVMNNGYFISKDNKFFCVPKNDSQLLKAATSLKSLREKLTMLSKLRSMSKVTGAEQVLSEKEFGGNSFHLSVESQNIFKQELYAYQRDGVHWLLHCCINNLGTILADDMGLGKTAQIIALVSEAFLKNLIERVFIIVPNSLLENWKREFEFFCPSLKPYLHYGPLRTGLAEVLSPYKIVIMPYTTMTSDIEMLLDLDISLLVFDEASLLKNPDSARSIAASRINSDCSIAMTGTPVENSLLDLWSITNIIYPGYLGQRESFCKQFIENNIQETLNKDLTGLDATISQIMIRRMKIDVLEDLPEKIDIHYPIIMPENEKRKYVEIVHDIRRDQNESVNILALITKLQQFTSHPSLLNKAQGSTVNSLIAESEKFKRLFELLSEIYLRKEKVLVFANHHAIIDIISESVQDKFSAQTFNIDGRIDVAERQTIIDTFSAVKGFSLLVLNPKTAGMGLNITSANHVIHYSRQWNPALEEQATARSFRNGQTKDVNVYYLFYVDTIEEVIDERLRLKRELADNVISIVDEKNCETKFYIENI